MGSSKGASLTVRIALGNISLHPHFRSEWHDSSFTQTSKLGSRGAGGPRCLSPLSGLPLSRVKTRAVPSSSSRIPLAGRTVLGNPMSLFIKEDSSLPIHSLSVA